MRNALMLNLDKWPGESVAVIDAQGGRLTYGELRDFAGQAGRLMPPRSLLFLLVEVIRRKPISPEIESRIHLAGFVLLIGLMLLLTYKDILGIATGTLL